MKSRSTLTLKHYPGAGRRALREIHNPTPRTSGQAASPKPHEGARLHLHHYTIYNAINTSCLNLPTSADATPRPPLENDTITTRSQQDVMNVESTVGDDGVCCEQPIHPNEPITLHTMAEAGDREAPYSRQANPDAGIDGRQ